MTSSMIPCAVVAADAELRARVMQILDDPSGNGGVTTELPVNADGIDRESGETLFRSDAQLVFVDLGDDADAALRYLRYLTQGPAVRTFVLTGPPVEAETLLELMRLGAAEYLPSPASAEALTEALQRALRRSATTQPEHAKALHRGRVFGIFSAKGGAGVTTTAANLAVQLRDATNKRTLLMDLDLEFGGAALALGLQPRYTVFDAVRSLHRLDDNLLNSFIVHHESGVDVLASPATPNNGEPLTREQVRTLLEFVRRRYEFVVIDLARVVNPISLSVFEHADDLIVLTTPDLPALRNTKKVLPLLRQTSGSNRRVRVLLNRCTPDDVISPADARNALGMDLFWSLPGDDPAVALATAAGTPVGATEKRSRYAAEMQRMVRLLGVVDATHVNGNGKHGIGGMFAGLRRLAGREAPAVEVKKHG